MTTPRYQIRTQAGEHIDEAHKVELALSIATDHTLKFAVPTEVFDRRLWREVRWVNSLEQAQFCLNWRIRLEQKRIRRFHRKLASLA